MQHPFDSDAPTSAAFTPSSPDQFADRAASTPAMVGQLPGALGDAGQPASSLASQARQKLVGTLNGQKSTAADFVEQLGQSIQRSGEQFEGRQDWIASAVGRGAAELNTLAGVIRDKDLGEFMGEVGAFARRQPALFIGTAMTVGFAIARIGKVVAGDLSRDDLPTVPEAGDVQH